MELKLPYGLKNEKLLSIDEVESGLKCNCICPACKKQLIAKKGTKNIHHFSHYKSEDCLSGLETALHKISKEIFEKSKTFTTPALFYPGTDLIIYEKTIIPIDSVKLEKKLGQIIPDIIIESKGKKLIIEIVVSNPLSFQKIQKIKELNIPAIVINAKSLFHRLYLKRNFGLKDITFEKELVDGINYKDWIHNPKKRNLTQNLLDNYSETKEVASFKQKDFGYFYYIDNCPLDKSIWKSGKKEGQSYASLEKDCANCEFHIKTDFKFIPHKRIDNHGYHIPIKIYCLGYLKNEFKELIKEIR